MWKSACRILSGMPLSAKGKVTREIQDGEDHLVDWIVWAENQRGEITAPGKADCGGFSQRVPGAIPYLYQH